MSKITLHDNGKVIKVIENKVSELNDYVVIVRVEHIKDLEKHNIPYSKLNEDFYLVTRGKKKKKFSHDQVNTIKKDLDNGLSIRKCANKYKCSTRTIQNIKAKKY